MPLKTLLKLRRANVEITFGKNLIPHFSTPDGKPPQDYLYELCQIGLRERYPNITDDIKLRLDYELKVIHESGFDTYF